MSLALWITCGVALAGLVGWRLRAATATLRTILAEPPRTDTRTTGTPDTDAPDTDAPATVAAPRPAAEPAAIAWPHPPRRLWADR